MNYEETVQYLFEQLPMFQRIGKAAYRKDLRNTIALARLAGNPENGFKSVHIAGTNGKGSTAHALASVFQACGYKTGLMTSPHYKDFRERIKIDGEMISKDFVQNWVAKFKTRAEHLKPSFFELSTIMGFAYFEEKQVDIAIIETGMGGRLDSTNIVSPELSIITPIALDHKTFLGDTIEQIALEKAGIIKQDIPTVLAEGNEGLLSLFESVSASRNSSLFIPTSRTEPIQSDLLGSYQQMNLNTVLEAVAVLGAAGWDLAEESVHEGILTIRTNTGFMGRWQKLSSSPLTFVDAAHNPQGIQAVIDQIKVEQFDRLHVVIGMVDDKEIDAVLGLMPTKATYYFCAAKVIRALACDELAQKASHTGLKGTCYDSVEAAVLAAKESAQSEDLIVITGSVFVVAEAL